jgi:hypothetical protein
MAATIAVQFKKALPESRFMYRFPRYGPSWLLLAGLCISLSAQGASLGAKSALAQISVRQLKVLGGKDAVEIEIEASDHIVPQTQVLTGPDRLVVDIPNAIPGSQLRSQSVNRGEVKDIRVALFQSKPPVTRIVLDLKRAQSYQVFPYGRSVMIKVIHSAAADTSLGVVDFGPSGPGFVNATYTTGTQRVSGRISAKPLEVSFRNGSLAIHADKATLSEVLFAVQQRTGADIAIPAGAEQERVVADLGPGPAQEVLARLLNGSKFNFLIMNAANDPRQLDRVILSPRPEGAIMPVTPAPSSDDANDEALPTTPVPLAPPPPNPAQQSQPLAIPPRPTPEIPPQAEENPQQ